MPRAARLLLTPALFLAIALAGCSASVTVDDRVPSDDPGTSETTVADTNVDDQVIPQAAVENDIAGSLEKSVGQRPDAVECPGDLSAQQGESIRCVLHAGADRLGVTATVTSASVQDGKLDYNLDVKVDDAPAG
jgi:hypothetical protein